MPTLTKIYTMEEASEHNTKDDCWVVVDGKVYDVSSYLDEHPGGDDVLLRATGKDATDEFEDGHSKTARELMEQYCIGELDQTPPPIPELEIVSKKQDLKGLPQKVLNLSKQYWVVPVTVVGLSVVVGFLYLKKK
ncbi:UNVERIFIED_CONTAM: cytochrome isoform A [Sesamum angustifolium]|uniref:Cytochrome isoform A n=1 Tax=Sesamum angustifolium TaxID=2727405 RepID=A0AAW2M9W1_9LAMI